MTIQPELPWDVAGIAPEAREAARASARREGLSVGEWLTRRILRGFAETEAGREDWGTRASKPPRAPETHDFSNGRSDAFADVLQTEIECQESRRRIADQLKSLSRRVEHTVREPSEPKQAVSDPAAEMTIASHEQPRTLDQIVARVARLDGRLSQIEQRPPAENARDDATVGALQTGLARLEAQVSQAASRSATRAAQLATAIEAVAGKFLQSRSESQSLRQDFESSVSTLAGNLGSLDERLIKSGSETEEQLRDVQERIAAVEMTTGRLEATPDSTARIDTSIEALTRRFDTNEAEHMDSIARLESRVTQIESGGEGLIDKRLQGIELALAGMASSIEKHAREKADTSEAIQSELRNLASRVEASGQREALSDTKAPYADAREEEAAPPFLHSNSNIPIFDLPPFPEKPPLAPTMPPPYDLRAAPDDHGKSTAAADSFLAAARRFARAGNSSAQQRNAAFSWVDAGSPQQAKDNSHTRLVLLGGIGLLVLAAVGAGLYLSNSFSRTTTIPQTAVVGPRSGHVGATPTVTRIQPAQSIPHLISIAAPAVKATRSAVAPKPVPFHLAAESSAPAPAARQVDAQSATAQSAAKPGMPQARLAALAKAGNAKAEEVLGLEYLDGDGVVVNEAEGAKWLERAAARGEAVAAYRLGTLYERGHGVTADHVRAARWYMAAANAGNRKAMHNLAVAYAQGSGVRKDLALAAQWFLRAANAGMADSQFNLAVLFERGMGVQQSLTQAYKWYAIAAAQGDPECKVRMEAIAPQLNAADKAAAEKAAADFQPAAVDRAANSPPIAASLVGG